MAWPPRRGVPRCRDELASKYLVRLSYYDEQVWAVVNLNQVAVVLREDFSVATTLEGVLFSNPREPSFDPAAL